MQDFTGKVAVVTGAASGIGFGLAERFAREGMKVVLADVEPPALHAAVTTLRQQEFDVLDVVTDVSKPESVEVLAQRTLDAYGGVHILCNNAGVTGGRGLLWDVTLKDWQWVFGVNYWGVLHGINTFLPIMLRQDTSGHVVNTASMAGLTPSSDPYGVTKHAVVALSEGLYTHLRLIQAKVGASVLCPGWVQTNLLAADRNRPADLRNENEPPLSGVEQTIAAAIAQEVAHGMLPERVAEIVVQGVRNEQFWITTTATFDDVVRRRMDEILARRNPQLPTL